jgi:CxxC-x17-CxxC domain-containing protein
MKDFGDRPRSGGFNRGGFRRNFGGPREMHKTKCSECGQECEVPFKPTEGRPVYCKDCFSKKRQETGIQ